MARSLNKVTLIGNLTRDPELRYTPQGTAVCSFSVATNRQWTIDSGEKKEDVEFHRIVAWNKLAEICAQLLKKGRKVYVEGRLQTRNWNAQDGTPRTTTEVVISEMIFLDSNRTGGREDFNIPEPPEGLENKPPIDKTETKEESKPKAKIKVSSKSKTKDKKDTSKNKEETSDGEDLSDDDIPF